MFQLSGLNCKSKFHVGFPKFIGMFGTTRSPHRRAWTHARGTEPHKAGDSINGSQTILEMASTRLLDPLQILQHLVH